MSNEIALLKVLEELLEEIDSLDGVEISRDLEPYKAQACWDDAVNRARDLVLKIKKQDEEVRTWFKRAFWPEKFPTEKK